MTSLTSEAPPKKRAKLCENKQDNGGEPQQQQTAASLKSTACDQLAPSYLYIVNQVNVCPDTNTTELRLLKLNETTSNVVCYLHDSWYVRIDLFFFFSFFF